MSCVKGSAKTGGRKKGTPNKSTQAAKDWIREFLEADRDLAAQDWANIDPEKRWDVRTKLFRHVAPQMSSIDLNDVTQEKNRVVDELKELVNDDSII